jgi:RNA polymerase sigma-70 factor (ECF subfamily)
VRSTICSGSQKNNVRFALLFSPSLAVYNPAKMGGHDHAGLLSDEALLHNIAHGCESCFDLLYGRFHRSLLNLSKKILKDGSEAEDVVQEVFLAIYEQRERFNPTLGPARTWVLQFGYYKSLRRRRDLQRRHFLEQAVVNEQDGSDPLLIQPEFIQRHIEAKEIVEPALALLGPGQRRIIEQLHFEGHTLREISTMEGRELSGIRNRYYKGLNALRNILREAGGQARTPVRSREREEYEIEL